MAALVEHSVPLPNGARAIAKREGVEVRQDVNGFTEEIVCVIRWEQIDHLRARVLGQPNIHSRSHAAGIAAQDRSASCQGCGGPCYVDGA
jgi:hypothetical protein